VKIVLRLYPVADSLAPHSRESCETAWAGPHSGLQMQTATVTQWDELLLASMQTATVTQWDELLLA